MYKIARTLYVFIFFTCISSFVMAEDIPTPKVFKGAFFSVQIPDNWHMKEKDIDTKSESISLEVISDSFATADIRISAYQKTYPEFNPIDLVIPYFERYLMKSNFPQKTSTNYGKYSNAIMVSKKFQFVGEKQIALYQIEKDNVFYLITEIASQDIDNTIQSGIHDITMSFTNRTE